MPQPSRYKNPFNRLKYTIEPETGCWNWIGGKDKDGYGKLSISSKPNGQMYWRAHRYSYYIHNGNLDKNKVIMHTCDNPSCINPDHLVEGTIADNNKDRNAKKRHMHGANHTRAVFSEQDVIDIKKSTLPERQLAKKYGCSRGAISGIKQGRTWKHL